MAVPRSRVLDLLKAQCRIFSNTYNPENVRTGNKVLRQRLKGPALTAYYPRKVVALKDLEKAYIGMEMDGDEKEDERLDHIATLKAKGKGAPKKKRTYEESKKYKASVKRGGKASG